MSGIHEGVSCDGCLTANFSGDRFKCLRCYDFDLCSRCYYYKISEYDNEFNDGEEHFGEEHCSSHPMQCIMTQEDFDLTYAGDPAHCYERCRVVIFTCPVCAKLGLSRSNLASHVIEEHPASTMSSMQHCEMLCPICISTEFYRTGFNEYMPNQMTDNMAAHMQEHHLQANLPIPTGLSESGTPIASSLLNFLRDADFRNPYGNDGDFDEQNWDVSRSASEFSRDVIMSLDGSCSNVHRGRLFDGGTSEPMTPAHGVEDERSARPILRYRGSSTRQQRSVLYQLAAEINAQQNVGALQDQATRGVRVRAIRLSNGINNARDNTGVVQQSSPRRSQALQQAHTNSSSTSAPNAHAVFTRSLPSGRTGYQRSNVARLPPLSSGVTANNVNSLQSLSRQLNVRSMGSSMASGDRLAMTSYRLIAGVRSILEHAGSKELAIPFIDVNNGQVLPVVHVGRPSMYVDKPSTSQKIWSLQSFAPEISESSNFTYQFDASSTVYESQFTAHSQPLHGTLKSCSSESRNISNVSHETVSELPYLTLGSFLPSCYTRSLKNLHVRIATKSNCEKAYNKNAFPSTYTHEIKNGPTSNNYELPNARRHVASHGAKKQTPIVKPLTSNKKVVSNFISQPTVPTSPSMTCSSCEKIIPNSIINSNCSSCLIMRVGRPFQNCFVNAPNLAQTNLSLSVADKPNRGCSDTEDFSRDTADLLKSCNNGTPFLSNGNGVRPCHFSTSCSPHLSCSIMSSSTVLYPNENQSSSICTCCLAGKGSGEDSVNNSDGLHKVPDVPILLNELLATRKSALTSSVRKMKDGYTNFFEQLLKGEEEKDPITECSSSQFLSDNNSFARSGNNAQKMSAKNVEKFDIFPLTTEVTAIADIEVEPNNEMLTKQLECIGIKQSPPQFFAVLPGSCRVIKSAKVLDYWNDPRFLQNRRDVFPEKKNFNQSWDDAFGSSAYRFPRNFLLGFIDIHRSNLLRNKFQQEIVGSLLHSMSPTQAKSKNQNEVSSSAQLNYVQMSNALSEWRFSRIKVGTSDSAADNNGRVASVTQNVDPDLWYFFDLAASSSSYQAKRGVSLGFFD